MQDKHIAKNVKDGTEIELISSRKIPRSIISYFIGRPSNFSYVDEHVSASGRPSSRKQIDWLLRRNIKTILSLTEDPISAEWLDGISYKHVPMKDHAPPTLESLSECVDFIISQSIAREKVHVHCAAGKGRTGTVLTAYLCRKHGLLPDQAILKLRAIRPGSVEKTQIGSVYSFCKNIDSGNS